MKALALPEATSPSTESSPASLDFEPTTEVREWPRPIHVASACAVVAGHVLLRHPHFSVVSGVWAGLLAATAFLALSRYATLWPARLPVIELALVFVYAQLGLPVTVQPLEVGFWNIMPSSESFEAAGQLAFFCGLALIAGFAIAVSLGRTGVPRRPRFLAPLDGEAVARAAAIYLPVAAVWVLLVPLFPGVKQLAPSIMTVIDGLFGKPSFAVVAVSAVLLAPSIGSRLRVIGAVTVLLLGMLQTSLLMEAVLPLAAAGSVAFRAKRRIPVVYPAAAVAVLLVLQPVKGTYRQLHWYGGYGVVEAWTEAFVQRAEGTNEMDATEATRSRMSELNVFAYTIDVVPRFVPHTNGKAYPVVLASMVPRLLWPEKPDLTKDGTDVFTITLGLQTEAGAETSGVGLSLAPQGYLEHGTSGSIGWMLLFGLVLGTIVRLFGSTLSGNIAVASITVGLIFGASAGLVYFLGSVIQSIILAIGVTWVLYASSRMLGRGRAPSRDIVGEAPARPLNRPTA